MVLSLEDASKYKSDSRIPNAELSFCRLTILCDYNEPGFEPEQ